MTLMPLSRSSAARASSRSAAAALLTVYAKAPGDFLIGPHMEVTSTTADPGRISLRKDLTVQRCALRLTESMASKPSSSSSSPRRPAARRHGQAVDTA